MRDAAEGWRIMDSDAWRKDPIKEVAWTDYGRRAPSPPIAPKHKYSTTTEYPIVLSRRRPQRSEVVASSEASNGRAKGGASDIMARLSLFPVFLRRVFTHPLKDFTLVKRGKEVIVVERGANLSGKDLTGVELRRADLSGAVLKGANLAGAVLREANLQGANLQGANLDGTDFGRADLRGAEVDPAVLRRAKFVGALLDDYLWNAVRRPK